MPTTALEPDAHGLLDVGDGHRVYWETVGDPAGRPALVVHGGPGAGCSVNIRRALDPTRYRTVLFDQRGCGRSLPHAADPTTSLAANTTEHLLADMEALRAHLGIDRWLLHGGSWGATLALAYAQRHPERVSALIVPGVTTTSPAEIDWLYRGLRILLPEAWERFRDHLPPAEHDDLLAGYARRTADPDPAVRAAATAAWLDWEDAVIAHEERGRPGAYGDRPEPGRAAMVRICAHYFSHGGFLAPDQILRDAHRLAGIPAVLVHGRLDLGSPLGTAWDLARAWPDADLQIVEDSGHTGSTAFRDALAAAGRRFAAAPARGTGGDAR